MKLRVKLASALLIGLIAMPNDAVKSQEATTHFKVVIPPVLPGDRLVTATTLLNGENRRNVEFYVHYSDNKNDLSSSNVSKGRASCKTLSADNLSCTFILPHSDHPEPNILMRQETEGGEPPETRPTQLLTNFDSNSQVFVKTDQNPKRIDVGKTVFYQWVKVVKRPNSAPTIFSDEIREFKMPRFLTIANVGDSYAAGEGAPNRNLIRTLESVNGARDNGKQNQFSSKPMWDHIPCHRSSKSGQMRAINQLIRERPGVALRYINVACSGADIDDGLIGEQEIPRDLILDSSNRRDVSKGEESQITALQKWLEKSGSNVLDIMLMSIGGNDVGFGDVGTQCIIFDLIPDCRDNSQLRSQMQGSIQKLPERFNKLKEIMDLYLEVDKVFLLEYPDPTRDREGLLCDDDILNDGGCWGVLERTIQQRDFAFIHDQLLVPLNKVLDSAAQKHGWTYLGGMMERSKNHGLCRCQGAYFNTPGMSDNIQGDLLGSIHPTVKGHKEIYQPIVYQALERHVSLSNAKRAAAVAREAAREAARQEEARRALQRRRNTALSEETRRFLADAVFKSDVDEEIRKRIQTKKPSPIKVKPVEVPNNDPDDQKE